MVEFHYFFPPHSFVYYYGLSVCLQGVDGRAISFEISNSAVSFLNLLVFTYIHNNIIIFTVHGHTGCMITVVGAVHAGT